MSDTLYRNALILIAALFRFIFCYVVIPPLLQDFDILGAFAAGFVNPYSSGYAADIFSCWAVLAVWVFHERKSVKGGWIALLLGVVPGVAVGLVVYLLMRQKQLSNTH